MADRIPAVYAAALKHRPNTIKEVLMGPTLLLGARMHRSLLLKALLAGALERGCADEPTQAS
jgi:hypothetical protein